MYVRTQRSPAEPDVVVRPVPLFQVLVGSFHSADLLQTQQLHQPILLCTVYTLHSSLRVGYGAENFSRLRRIALNKLKRWEIKKPNGRTLKVGLRTKQQACGWSHEFLLQTLVA